MNLTYSIAIAYIESKHEDKCGFGENLKIIDEFGEFGAIEFCGKMKWGKRILFNSYIQVKFELASVVNMEVLKN